MKKIFFILIIGFCLVFFFSSEAIPESFQPQEILDATADKDVIIIFNSGGWGNTPFEDADDFAPIIKGIERTLNQWGYNPIVIPYQRIKDGFSGKIIGTKEFFNSFQSSSENLSAEIEFLAKSFPDKKIIMAGLSNGATFVSKTYENISEDVKDSVYAIAVGTPFWAEAPQSDNILQLDNKGKDTLVEGDAWSLLWSLAKTPFLKAFLAPGHNYFWESPEVSSQVITFLEEKFR